MPLFRNIRTGPNRFLRAAALLTFFLALVILTQPLAAQETSEAPGEEVVVNLATGRVIIAVVELIVGDYIQGYGPEVWRLTFLIKQEMQRLDYYDTRASHPTYVQMWPPEKGQPHTLVEFQYPPDKTLPTLMDLLRQKDPRIEKICASDAKMRDVADGLLAGQSNKLLSVDATQFLRAALVVLSPPNARLTMAAIGMQTAFEWILRPPVEPN